jgi:hypothetical protein
MTADPARTKGPRHRRATRHSPPGRLVVALAALAGAVLITFVVVDTASAAEPAGVSPVAQLATSLP